MVPQTESDIEQLFSVMNLRIVVSVCHVVRIDVSACRYVPTWFWGKSGHIQTVLYSKVGRRIDSPIPSGSRCTKLLADGATMTYDIFQPVGNSETGGPWILFLLLVIK